MKKSFFLLLGLCMSTLTFAQFTTNGANLYFTGGNVGIGTTAPTHKLSVNGTIKAEGTDGRIMLENASANTSIYMRNRGASNERKFEILYGTSVKYVMDNNGNVGIGTTSPDSKLHIINSVNNSTSLNIDGNLIEANGGSVSKYQDISFTASGAAGNAAIRHYANAWQNARSELGFLVNNNSGLIEALRINNEGNVGIGTSSPNSSLDIYKDFSSFSNTGQSIIRLTNPSSTGQSPLDFFINNTLRGRLRADYVGNLNHVANGGDHYFFTGGDSGAGTSKMIIKDGGNVGIGTTSPIATLEVADTGDAQLQITSSSDFGNAELSFLNSYDNYGFKQFLWNGGKQLHFNFGNEFNGGINATTNIMTLHDNGNIGMNTGTTTPLAKLHIEGDVLIKSGEKLQWGGSQTAIEGSTVSNKIGFFTNSLERLRVDDGGNVGIGTTSPSHTLTVKGGASATKGINIMDANSRIYFDGKRAMEGHAGASRLDIAEGYSTTQIFGNVGIGTSNPTEKLAVDGTVLAKKARVSVSAVDWPDYVFAPNFELRDLSKLETYIKQNQHLPEVPSAQEVETNGLDLGKMDATLLKKIEELTLYLISQDKNHESHTTSLKEKESRINKLETENQELKNRLDRIETLLKALTSK